MQKKVVILGAGESGIGSAILAMKQGFEVFVSDKNLIRPRYRNLLGEYMIPFEEDKHTEEKILSADEVIKSPGITEKAEIVQKLIEHKIPVISEIEFAGRYTNAKTVCITGSNGKTTTTSLIYHLMRKAGLNVGMAGNIGTSFALQVAEENYDYYVLELSSFQLDGIIDFKPDIAILLNITPDHLDRYDYKLQKYVDSKFKIIQNLTEEEYFVFCSDDEITMNNLERIVTKAKQLSFSMKEEKREGAYIENNNIKIEFEDIDFSMSVEELSLKGRHNTYNSMAAGITGNILKLRKPIIRESLSDFQGVEHRLEKLFKVRGVEFVNDSKATNVNSTWYALESIEKGIVWIAGGIDKGNDYSILSDLVLEKVIALVCLGKDNSKLHEAFQGVIPTIVDALSMKEAVNKAFRFAEPGNSVLLSPACASFDLFDDYEDRGRQFKQCIREL
jgi:UDP-N-acetylmuramoylalanine--D-glutamate ligase